MIHWLWIVPGFVAGLFFGAIILSLCAMAAITGAEEAAYRRGREVGRREGYAAGLAGDEMEEAA